MRPLIGRDAVARRVAFLTMAGLVLVGCGASITSPTPAITATPSPAAKATSLPSALQASWIDAPRVVSQLGTQSVLPALTVASQSVSVRLDLSDVRRLVSSATISAPGMLALTLAYASTGCSVGAVGTYAWSLAPGGASLTLTASGDACAARAAAFSGTWTRSACRNPQNLCLGAVPAGTYVSTFFDLRDASAAAPPRGAYGELRYTLPAGWANGDDFPTDFNLIPAVDYAGPVGVPDGDAFYGIYLFARAAATAGCTNQLAPGVGQTPAALATWVASQPGVVATTPTPVTVGGYPGVMLDLRLAPSWTGKCSGDNVPSAILLMDASGAAGAWNFGLGGTERQRLILVAPGGPTVAIFIDDSSPSRFTDLVAQAMPIVTTLQFPQ